MAKQNNTKRTGAGNGSFQRFYITAPTATKVQLVGDFTQWQQKPILMQKGAAGIWHAEVKLAPGEHHYRFLVDDQWQDDPECSTRTANPYGGQDSVCQVA